MTETASWNGLSALQATFPGLVVDPATEDEHFEKGDALRVVALLHFKTNEKPGRPELECRYEIKLIVPRAFPAQLPRTYSIDGQISKDYHTNPTGDLCLGPPLHLQEILREDPTLLGFIHGAITPYLYRHRYTILHDGEGPPGWEDLEHGTPSLLDYYEKKLDACGYQACLALLRHAGEKQRTGRRGPCPCGSGRTLNACHYQRMAGIRRSAGRGAVMGAYWQLKEQGHLAGIDRLHN